MRVSRQEANYLGSFCPQLRSYQLQTGEVSASPLAIDHRLNCKTVSLGRPASLVSIDVGRERGCEAVSLGGST
ncbi:MAG: hypothetical protein ACUVTH_02390, partial [Thermogutta sp.]